MKPEDEIYLPVRFGGQERSVLELLQEMKETLILEKRREKNRKPVTGKHSGSRLLSEEEEGRLRMTDVDLSATIRADPAAFREGKANLRFKRYRGKYQMSILFVVDASRSQGNHERLSFVKGAVQAVLQQAYTERNKAGVIVFGNKQAQVALPFTRSVEFAAAQMEQLTAKGNTPLAAGLRLAVATLEQERRKYPENLSVMVLLTDGKCNYDDRAGQPLKLALEAAEELKKKHFPVLVVDTESSVFGLGLAKKMAEAAGGRYVELV